MFTQLWSIGAGGIDWLFPFLGNFLRTHSYLDLFSSFPHPFLDCQRRSLRKLQAQNWNNSYNKKKWDFFYLVRMRRWQGLGGEWPKSTFSLLFKMGKEIFLSEIVSLEPGGNAVWWPGIKISEQPQAYLFPISLHFAPIYRQVSKKNAKSRSTILITVFTNNVSISFVYRMQYQITLSIARGSSKYLQLSYVGIWSRGRRTPHKLW